MITCLLRGKIVFPSRSRDWRLGCVHPKRSAKLSTQQLPSATPTINTEELRQRLAGLVDPQAEKPEWYAEAAKDLAVQFCAALPAVFGSNLDRMTMWDKIASAIQSGYAKTVSGDLDLFVQHVLESIQADPAKAVACDRLTDAIDELQQLPKQERQDWLQYLVTHLIPVLVYARRDHKYNMEAGR